MRQQEKQEGTDERECLNTARNRAGRSDLGGTVRVSLAESLQESRDG